jgi:hypothetical protein
VTLAHPGRPATVSSEAVVGLHLAVPREREVEHELVLLGEALLRHGVDVTWLTTHRTETDLGPACSAAVTATTDADLLAGYLHVVGRELADTVGGFELATRDGGDAGERASAAAAARSARTEGRAVWFPGHRTVGGQITVAALLDTTAIDAVEVLGAAGADPATVIETRGFVRPRFVADRLVLHVQPARGGVLVPFETPNPTPCCADHA